MAPSGQRSGIPSRVRLTANPQLEAGVHTKRSAATRGRTIPCIDGIQCFGKELRNEAQYRAGSDAYRGNFIVVWLCACYPISDGPE